MSTTMYLRCVTHDPYISSDEVGHNTSYLPEIRKGLRERTATIEGMKAAGLDVWDLDLLQPASNQLRFMLQHPHCELEIWDEYGRQYSMEDTVEEKPIAADTVLGRIIHIEQTGDGVVFTMRNLTPEGERVFRKLSQ